MQVALVEVAYLHAMYDAYVNGLTCLDGGDRGVNSFKGVYLSENMSPPISKPLS